MGGAASPPAVGAELLRSGLSVRIPARGASMAPFIRDGDEVLVEPLARPPRRGEVVLVRVAGGAVVLHRVLASRAGGVVTRGDAQEVPDAPVPAAEVLGRAVAVAGRRRLHLQAPFGRLVLGGLGLRRLRLAAGPLRPLARALRALGARL